MANFTLRVALVGAALLVSTPHDVRASNSTPGTQSVTLQTVSNGNVQWDYLTVTDHTPGGDKTYPAPPRAGAYCYYSRWDLLSVNALSHDRHYAIYAYNACDGDSQVIPVNPNQCVNDDGHHNKALPSTCVTIAAGHTVAGLSPSGCGAESVASVALRVKTNPDNFDATKDVQLTTSTSFASDFIQRLREGTCTDVLSWSTVSWTFVWPDGSHDNVPGSGTSGITLSHTIKGSPEALQSTTADVTAIAHLHIHGTAMDFDAGGNMVSITRDAFVDISNNAASSGVGATPAYTPPQLAAGGIGVSENMLGAFPAVDLGGLGSAQLIAIEGHLLRVYPRAIVLAQGTETINGILIGYGSTSTVRWTYLGGYTDAPLTEATAPESEGSAAAFIQVQYNHAEQINNDGAPVDALLPVAVVAQTTYPDGHVDTEQVRSDLRVRIFYTGMNFSN